MAHIKIGRDTNSNKTVTLKTEPGSFTAEETGIDQTAPVFKIEKKAKSFIQH